MGCLSRVGCLVVLAGAGAVGYWLYGDRLPSELSRAAGKAASKVGQAVGEKAGTRSGESSKAEPRPSVITWATISPTRASSTNAESDPLAPLTRANGPAYINLGTGQLADVLSASLPAQLPRSATNVQIALADDQLLMRAVMDVADIAGDGTLGQMLGMALTGRDSLQFGGTLQPLTPGFVQYRVQSLRVKGFEVPPRLIPTVMNAVRIGARKPGLADDAFAVRLPRTIADLRIANGRLTLYKAVSNP